MYVPGPSCPGTRRPRYPPAMAPTTTNGSVPFVTSDGGWVSGDTRDRSCAQAKNRTNGLSAVGHVIADNAFQHRVGRFERVEHLADGHRSRDVESHLVLCLG